MTVEELRKEFPALQTKVYGKPLVYFDNAATAHRPSSVIEFQKKLSIEENANIHRAVHYLSSKATAEYEQARTEVADFIGAKSREEIVFTSGTTAAINLLANCLGESGILPGDEIIVAECEHHSDFVPWYLMAQRKKARLVKWGVEDDGALSLQQLDSLINTKTRIVCFAGISNVLGIINPIREIVELCHSKGVLAFCDAAQAIVHEKIDVSENGVDFLAFSGHKIYAATGTGVLYGKKSFLEELPPYMGGGEMIDRVSFEETTFAPVPMKFEAGTQNFNSVPTLIPALEIAAKMRDLEDNTEKVKSYLYNSLIAFPGLKMFGTPKYLRDKAPVFSFCIEGAHHEDLALLLDKMGVAVRSGQMCAEPVMDRFHVSGVLRVSAAPYNTLGEAQYFMESLDRAVKMLR